MKLIALPKTLIRDLLHCSLSWGKAAFFPLYHLGTSFHVVLFCYIKTKQNKTKLNASLYQTRYFTCNEFRCGIVNDRFHGLKFGVSFCTGSCQKDSQINNGHEPLLYSVSIPAAKQAQFGCLLCARAPPVTGRLQAGAEGTSVTTACYRELFQLAEGPVLVPAGQTPGCWVLWGLSQAHFSPGFCRVVCL